MLEKVYASTSAALYNKLRLSPSIVFSSYGGVKHLRFGLVMELNLGTLGTLGLHLSPFVSRIVHLILSCLP